MSHTQHKKEVCKTGLAKMIDRSLYWVLLILAILANFVVSVVLVPFLMAMKGVTMYFILFVIGTTFGFFFSQVLRAIHLLHPRQHLFLGILVPAVALINIAIITMLSNQLIVQLKLTTPLHTPWIIAIIYVIAYTVPELAHHKFKRKNKYFVLS